MDKKFMVYGRAFNDENVIDTSTIKCDYSTIFFNKEGDVWKVVDIAVKYGIETKLYVKREIRYKASNKDGLTLLRDFAQNKNVAIDCSFSESLYGITDKVIAIEKYTIEDFDKSVAQLNLVLSNNTLMIDTKCKLTKNDIEAFKFTKSKDDNVKYITEKDGFVSCLRVALKYYGIN